MQSILQNLRAPQASLYSDFTTALKSIFFFEMGMRKPDPDIYTTVINNHELIPKHTLFVDDKENTDAALQLGLMESSGR
jgi:putative hydrolase of the HAD superfamily